jgi:hypothetical protein
MNDHGLALLVRPAGNKECKCVGKHVPLPSLLHSHHIIPLYYGGETTPGNLVWLCPTTHVNVHDLIREYEKAGGRPSGEIRKHYSRFVQSLAGLAWVGRKTTES